MDFRTKYKIVEVKDKNLANSVKDNVAFVFDGIINFDIIYSSLVNWIKKSSINLYVLSSEMVNDWYGYKPTSKKVVCVLLEDLKEKIIVKNQLREVYKRVISKNKIIDKLFNLNKFVVSKRIKIEKALFDNSFSLYNLIYGKQTIYSRVERYIDDTFILDYVDEEELADKVIGGRDFYILHNYVLKLNYQKDFYNYVKYSNKNSFYTYPVQIYDFEFIKNDYKTNQDIVKMIKKECRYWDNDVYKLELEKVIKEDYSLEEGILNILFHENNYSNYRKNNDEDFFDLKVKIKNFAKKLQKEYGEFITCYSIKTNTKVVPMFGFDVLVFQKGILVVLFYSIS